MGCVQTFPRSPSECMWGCVCPTESQTDGGEGESTMQSAITVSAAKENLPLLSCPLPSSSRRSVCFLSEADGNWHSTLVPWKKHLGQQFSQQLLQRRDRRKRTLERMRPVPPTHTQTYKHIYIYIDIYSVHYWCHPVLHTLPYNVLFNTFREHFSGACVPCDKVMHCVVFKLD